MPNIVMSEIGDNLMQSFLHNLTQAKMQEERMIDARVSLAKSKNLLGRWLLPLDAKLKEPYNIIIGNRIFSVIMITNDRTCFEIDVIDAKFERQEDIK